MFPEQATYQPYHQNLSKPQSRLWQPPWTLADLEVDPWLDIGQGSVRHSHYRLLELYPGKETTDHVFDFFSSVPHFGGEHPRTPAYMHDICPTTRFPYTGHLPNMVVPHRWLVRHFFPNAIHALSAAELGQSYHSKLIFLPYNQDLRPIYKACRLNVPSPPSFLESPHPRTACFSDWWLLSPALCQRMIDNKNSF